MWFGGALLVLLSSNLSFGFQNHAQQFRISRPLSRRPFLASSTSASVTVEDYSSYFTIETTNTGPAESVVHTLTIHKLPGQEDPPPEEEEKEAVEEVELSAETTEEAVEAVDSSAETAEAVVTDEEVLNGDGDEKEILNGNESTEAAKEAPPPPKKPKIVAEPPIVIQTGKIGRQAAGAVTLSRGDTVLYATAARDSNPKDDLDFLPLSVEHQERFSSAGTTSGSYNKRDGRPAEHEVLTCRLIDRPLRPLIAEGWRHETQLLSWVLSYDGVRSCDALAIVSSATALYLSDVPLSKPVAAVIVGYYKDDDKLLLNPTNEQMERSDLQLIVAGTKDAVLMIEGAANFLPEETMVKAVTFGHDAIKVLCAAIEELGRANGVAKNYSTIKPPLAGLQERVDKLMTDKVDAMYALGGTKIRQGPVKKELQNELLAALEGDYPELKSAIFAAFKSLLCKRMFALAKSKGIRSDGRKLDEIRRLDMEVGFLPRVHGSALFTRGETQVVATATLGGSGMRQKIDKLDGVQEKRFYLQYNFPPSCVGETGRVGMPGRREIGHGNLAERYVFVGLLAFVHSVIYTRLTSVLTCLSNKEPWPPPCLRKRSFRIRFVLNRLLQNRMVQARWQVFAAALSR
jgi:ribonuclease PH